MHRVRRLSAGSVAVILAIALVATSCGSNGGSTSSPTSANNGPPSTGRVIPSEGQPVHGGQLVYGVEAETDGWNPTINRWAVSGHDVGQAIFDQLATVNANDKAVPYLAQSITPNSDYTQWKIKVRPNVKFHNGEALTSKVVKANIEAYKASGLAGPAVRPIEKVDIVDDLTVNVTMSQPWAVFPYTLTTQVGYIIALAQLNAPKAESNAHPIGTGPFIFKQWVPDNKFVAVRNPNYWQKGLPYLDQVTFKPIPENQSRSAAFDTGGLDMFHTDDPTTLLKYRKEAQNGQVQMIEDGGVGEEGFIMLNVAKAPFDDVRVREALAYATNRVGYAQVIDKGVLSPAASPFISSSKWHSPAAEAEYPKFDLAKAKELVSQYEADKGPLKINLGYTQSDANRLGMQYIQGTWKQAGIDVTLQPFEQGQFILNALGGQYEAYLWRQFGASDPDGEYVWWDQRNAAPIGQIGLNFARNKDPVVNKELDIGRGSADMATRKAAYDKVQVQLNKDIPYIWLDHTVWGVVANDNVRNLGTVTLPDGSKGLALGTGFAGGMRVTQIWKTKS